MTRILGLNTDTIENPKALIAKLSTLPVKPVLGVVCDAGYRAQDVVPFAKEVGPHVEGFIYRPFDSYSLMLRNSRGEVTGPRYTVKTYRDRSEDYCKVLGRLYCHSIEFGNELSPDDPDWLPVGIWGCVAKALEVATAYGVRSMVTWFAQAPGVIAKWHASHPLSPDIGAVSVYSRASGADMYQSLVELQGMVGDIPKMVSEYGSQDDEDHLGSSYTELSLIKKVETMKPAKSVTNYLGSINWNALAGWKWFQGMYQDLFGGEEMKHHVSTRARNRA